MNTNPQKTSDLIRNGEYERAWERHCGFFDLSTDEFMQIQWRLLEEQFALARKGRAWRTLFPQALELKDIRRFREVVPLTDYYTHYAELLADKPDDILGRPIVAWARTSGRGGQPKWAPYTQEAYRQLGFCSTAAHMLSAAHNRGDVNVRPNDLIALNLPARPFLSGLAIWAVADMFDFRFLPPLEESERLSFQERIATVFQQAMRDGMDILGSMTIVLVKMGEQFEQGANQSHGLSPQMLHPRVLMRYARAWLSARREGRTHVLPRDLWQPKGIMCGGTDTALYRERIKHYWGVYPHETYACTEAGLMATQAWDHKDMVFFPATAFYEFIPESDWAAERLSGTTPNRTLLLDELEAGKRYEVVISNFYGGPLLRYRMHDLIEVTAQRDKQLGIRLPQFRFVGRSGDFIDLSGFAGLVDERQLTAALVASGVKYTDWVVCKEITTSEPLLHMYIEPAAQAEARAESGTAADEIAQRVHAELTRVNHDYGNIETMLGFIPLRVSILSPGTFARYTEYQTQHGADLAHMKPNRIQPSAKVMEVLLAGDVAAAQAAAAQTAA
jgi:hypothetical protein